MTSGRLDAAPSKAAVLQGLCDTVKLQPEVAQALHKSLYKQKLDTLLEDKKLTGEWYRLNSCTYRARAACNLAPLLLLCDRLTGKVHVLAFKHKVSACAGGYKAGWSAASAQLSGRGGMLRWHPTPLPPPMPQPWAHILMDSPPGQAYLVFAAALARPHHLHRCPSLPQPCLSPAKHRSKMLNLTEWSVQMTMPRSWSGCVSCCACSRQTLTSCMARHVALSLRRWGPLHSRPVSIRGAPLLQLEIQGGSLLAESSSSLAPTPVVLLNCGQLHPCDALQLACSLCGCGLLKCLSRMTSFREKCMQLIV